MELIEATKNNDLELVKKLIKKGCRLDKKNKWGETALMIASLLNYKEIVKELIKAGASLNEKDEYNWTSLSSASVNGHIEIIKELIKSGASLIERNNNGHTALFYNKKIWQPYEIQDLILTMYPDKYSLLEEEIGIHKDILLKLKMQQILDI